MKLKSLLTTLALSSAMIMPMTAMSATTPIKFAKGSSCSSYSGNVVDKKFTLFLNANQELSIDDVDDLPFTVKVQLPQGKIIEPELVGAYKGNADDTYYVIKKTPRKGTYTVRLIPDSNAQYADVKFCVY